MLIIIPEYGKRHLTNRLIKSLPERYRKEVRVGVDGYPMTYAALIAGKERAFRENLGFAGNVNRTIEWAGADRQDAEVLMIVNNDVEFVNGLGRIEQAAGMERAIFGPVILVDPKYTKHPKRHHQLFDSMSVNTIEKPLIFLTALSGACLVMRLGVWRELGGFDAGSFPAYFEDDDLCIRAYEKNIPRAVFTRAIVRHDVAGTYGGIEHRNRLIRASKAAFKRKWPGIEWDTTGIYEIKGVEHG